MTLDVRAGPYNGPARIHSGRVSRRMHPYIREQYSRDTSTAKTTEAVRGGIGDFFQGFSSLTKHLIGSVWTPTPLTSGAGASESEPLPEATALGLASDRSRLAPVSDAVQTSVLAGNEPDAAKLSLQPALLLDSSEQDRGPIQAAISTPVRTPENIETASVRTELVAMPESQQRVHWKYREPELWNKYLAGRSEDPSQTSVLEVMDSSLAERGDGGSSAIVSWSALASERMLTTVTQQELDAFAAAGGNISSWRYRWTPELEDLYFGRNGLRYEFGVHRSQSPWTTGHLQRHYCFGKQSRSTPPDEITVVNPFVQLDSPPH